MTGRPQTYEDRMNLRAAWPIKPPKNRVLRKVTPKQLQEGYYVFDGEDAVHHDYGFYYLADDGENFIVEELA